MVDPSNETSSEVATIASEHARIVELIGQLDEGTDWRSMRRAVDALSELIPKHFRDEEAEGGFFSQVLEERPEFKHKLDLLHEAHEGMLVLLAKLHDSLADVARQLEAVEVLKTDLIVRIRAHESVEGKLISDVYMQDEGQGETG